MQDLVTKKNKDYHVALEKRHNSNINESLIIDELDRRISYTTKTQNTPELKEINIARNLVQYFNTNIIFLPIRNIP
jgi:hypothetical protein